MPLRRQSNQEREKSATALTERFLDVRFSVSQERAPSGPPS
jgi:hypothetical protein